MTSLVCSVMLRKEKERLKILILKEENLPPRGACLKIQSSQFGDGSGLSLMPRPAGEIVTQDGNSQGRNSDLQRRAESSFAQKAGDAVDISTLSHGEVQKPLHELQVHQIELEMQNEELRSAQIALQDSRSKYPDLYDFAPVGYLTLNDKGLILEANLTAARLLDMNRESLIQRPFSRFVCREDGDTVHLHINRVFESADRQTCDIRIVRNGDSQLHAQLDTVAIQDGERHLSKCLMAITDITEHTEAEEALKESEARVRTKLDSIISPGSDIGTLELADVIDAEEIQMLMDDFDGLTNIGVAILDMRGKVLLATGWQDICT